MIRGITPFVFDENQESHNYNNEFVLLNKPLIEYLTYPVKLDVTITLICLKGQLKGKANMRYFETEVPCLVILMADYTVSIESVSEDFSALFIIMSRKFTDSLKIEERLPVFLSLNENPCIPLEKSELMSFQDYFKMTQKVLNETHNPFII